MAAGARLVPRSTRRQILERVRAERVTAGPPPGPGSSTGGRGTDDAERAGSRDDVPSAPAVPDGPTPQDLR